MSGTISGQAMAQPVTNALAPSEGPKSVTVRPDFSAGNSYMLDCTLLQSQGILQSVQAIYVDNSNNAAALIIAVQSGQSMTVPPYAQGYLPILAPSPAKLTFSSTGGVVVQLQLLNVPMPALLWSANTSNGLPIIGGLLQVQDATLETAIVAGLVQSQLLAVNGASATALACDANGRLAVQASKPTAVTSHSLVTAATPASAALMPLNAARQYVFIQAPLTADLWINPNGGAASVGGADCIRIVMGAYYESNACAFSEAITYYCATGGLQLTAFEG